MSRLGILMLGALLGRALALYGYGQFGVGLAAGMLITSFYFIVLKAEAKP
jgi:hypothetical protein